MYGSVADWGKLYEQVMLYVKSHASLSPPSLLPPPKPQFAQELTPQTATSNPAATSSRSR